VAELSEANAEIQRLTLSNRQLIEQFEKAMMDIQFMQQELNSYKNQVGNQTREDADLAQKLRQQYELRIKELSEEVNIRGKDRDSLLSRIAELEAESRRIATEFGLLHEQIAERDEIIRRLRVSTAQSPEEAQEKIRLLIIENERMIALNARLGDEIKGLKMIHQQYQELQIDYGVLQVNTQKLESMLQERNFEIDELVKTIHKLSDELKIKVRIIDEKTFMLVDLEGEIEKMRRDTTETTKFLRELNLNKEIINRLEEDNDRLRLEITKLKEEFLFKNQTEETMATLRKALDDEKEFNTTKEFRIKDLEDRLSFLNPTVTGIPLLNSSNQALKDEVFKLQNQNQEKDLLLYKMKEVAQEMQKEIDRIPELQLATDNQVSENKRLKGLLEQKDRILQDYTDKFDLLKESLSQVLILEEKIKYLEEEIVRLTKALGNSEAISHKLQATVSELQRANQKIPDLNSEIRFLKDELERITRQSKEKDGLLTAERDRYQQYMTELQVQSKNYLNQVAELEKMLRETKINESQMTNNNHGLINTLQNKIRELVLALTHMKDDNDKLDGLLNEQRRKFAAAEKDLVALIAIKKEKDTAVNELERTKNDLKALATVLSNSEEKVTRLEGMQGKNRILENENNQLREEIRGLENRVRDLIHQRERINNDVNMSIEKGRTNGYTMATQIEELKAQVKQQTDLVVFKDREIVLLKAEIEDLLHKLRKGDLTFHELKAQFDALDVEYKGGQTKLAEREEQLREALKVDFA
jgi:chromosome segregation ATPase